MMKTPAHLDAGGRRTSAIAPSAPLPHARGPISAAVLRRYDGDASSLAEFSGLPTAASEDSLVDEDLQLALFLLYASAYGSLPAIDARLEWDGELLALRGRLERRFEDDLRRTVRTPPRPLPTAGDVADALFALTDDTAGPSLSRLIARDATRTQALEFLIQRSVYTLREADPHSWAIPRLVGRPKAALVEIQSDEYGGGRPERVHAEMFAATMRGAGLDDAYGTYVDAVPAVTLAAHNVMSLFGLNRRLVGSIVGHLAAFEMTSTSPNRRYAAGLRRLGFGDDVAAYFDEHVEADAVHEQVAARDLAGALAEDRPDLLEDILFGAAACLHVDGRMGAHMLTTWADGASSLRSTERR